MPTSSKVYDRVLKPILAAAKTKGDIPSVPNVHNSVYTIFRAGRVVPNKPPPLSSSSWPLPSWGSGFFWIKRTACCPPPMPKKTPAVEGSSSWKTSPSQLTRSCGRSPRMTGSRRPGLWRVKSDLFSRRATRAFVKWSRSTTLSVPSFLNSLLLPRLGFFLSNVLIHSSLRLNYFF